MKNVSQNLKKKPIKIETSKLILIALSSSVGLIIPIVIVLAFMGALSPLELTIQGLFRLTAIAVGFYYWKAKCENMHKYKQDNSITMKEDNDYT